MVTLTLNPLWMPGIGLLGSIPPPSDPPTTEPPSTVPETTTTEAPIPPPAWDQVPTEWHASILLVGVLTMAAVWALLGRVWTSGQMGK